MKNPKAKQPGLSVFLNPKHWPLWTLLGLLYCAVKLLPYPALLFTGKWVGKGYYLIARRARQITQINLAQCFPELSAKKRNQLCKENFATMGMTLIEIGLATWGNEQQLKPLCQINGWEHLDAAKANGKGVLLLTAHLLSPDLGGRLLRLKTPFSALALIPHNAVMNWVMRRSRAKFLGENIHPSNVRALIKRLKNNEVVWYAADQDLGAKQSVFAPFFNVETATALALSRIAKISGAQMVPFFQYRDPKTHAYILEFLPALKAFPSGHYLEDATRINALLEKAIRQQPAHYYWQYKRFQTRPIGEPELYPTKVRKPTDLLKKDFHIMLRRTRALLTEEDKICLYHCPDGYWIRLFPPSVHFLKRWRHPAFRFARNARKLEQKGILTAQIKRFRCFKHNGFYAINFKYFDSVFLAQALADSNIKHDAQIALDKLKQQCRDKKIDLSRLEPQDYAYLPTHKTLAVIAPHKVGI